MMAAGQAASLGAEVLLIERNREPGRKLLLTGQGRCNITNNLEAGQFISDCGPKARFLHGALARFSTDDAVGFFQGLGLKLKLERGGRYFPESEDSHDVLNTLLSFLRQSRVRLARGRRVEKVRKLDDLFLVEAQGVSYTSSRLILATGGKSYPATGSTGDGYEIAGALGHRIISPRPTDVPLVVEGPLVKKLQGLSLRNVSLKFRQGERQASFFGEMLFTHYGISGPIVLDASRLVVDWLAHGPVAVRLDLKPALDSDTLDHRLRREIAKQGQRSLKNLLRTLMPSRLVPVFLAQCGLEPGLEAGRMTWEQRRTLGQRLKDIRFTVTASRGFEEAVVTAGGVDTKEVDPRTMESKIVPGLYFCGEVLDVDGPCGGYNLQIAWSTGFVAGRNAGEKC